MVKYSIALLSVLFLFLAAPRGSHAPVRVNEAVADAPLHDLFFVVDTLVDADPAEVVDQYCVRCHNDRSMRGNLTLEGFDVAAPETSPEVAEKVGESLKQSERHMTTCDIQRTPDTLEAVVTGLPSSLQPGHAIDRQILLALELLGENEPDIATARSIVQNVLNRLTVVETMAASADEGSGGVG